VVAQHTRVDLHDQAVPRGTSHPSGRACSPRTLPPRSRSPPPHRECGSTAHGLRPPPSVWRRPSGGRDQWRERPLRQRPRGGRAVHRESRRRSSYRSPRPSTTQRRPRARWADRGRPVRRAEGRKNPFAQVVSAKLRMVPQIRGSGIRRGDDLDVETVE
jgi:hypothetical protein